MSVFYKIFGLKNQKYALGNCDKYKTSLLSSSVWSSDGSGSKFFDPGRVGSGQPFMVWVWIWEISPKIMKFFNFFPFVSKKNIFRSGRKVTWLNAGLPLIYGRSKSSTGRVGSGTISSLTPLRICGLGSQLFDVYHK